MAVDDAGLETGSRPSADPPPWIPRPELPVAWRLPVGGTSAAASGRRVNGHGRSLRRAVPPRNGTDAAIGITSIDVEDFLHALRNGREAAVVDLVDRHVERGIREERVYLDLLAPAARRLGELWEEDRANYFQVTLLVGRIQGLVHRLGRNRFEPTRPEHAGETRSVLLAAPAGEQHTLGLVIVGELFLRGGWSVAMGRPMDPAPTAERVAREWFDLVGLSVSRDVTLEDARDAIRAIRRESRNRNVRVILGGRVCSGSPEAIRSLGADSWASDGEDAVAVAKKLCRGDS